MFKKLVLALATVGLLVAPIAPAYSKPDVSITIHLGDYGLERHNNGRYYREHNRGFPLYKDFYIYDTRFQRYCFRHQVALVNVRDGRVFCEDRWKYERWLRKVYPEAYMKYKYRGDDRNY